MSKLGFERHLSGLGLSLARTAVGDRYVVEYMRTHDYNLGGEQSGHIILNDYITTGDALIAALQVLAVVVERNRPVSEVCRARRSEEHTSELQSLMRISYAVFCLKKKNKRPHRH